MPRGGRRPGAGAPIGNVNGMKTGLYSQRFYGAALMIAAVPELRAFFKALQQEQDFKKRERLLKLIATAVESTVSDPELAKAIKELVLDRVRRAVMEIRAGESNAENLKNLIKQSKRQ